jgi:hypothetical protein
MAKDVNWEVCACVNDSCFLLPDSLRYMFSSTHNHRQSPPLRGSQRTRFSTSPSR